MQPRAVGKELAVSLIDANNIACQLVDGHGWIQELILCYKERRTFKRV
jgi:hypothetical protein